VTFLEVTRCYFLRKATMASVNSALEAQIEKSRVEIERAVPYRVVAYRADQTTQGRRVTISGEIRVPTIGEVAFWIELLRRLADDETRLLDFEDDTTSSFNAKMVDPGYALSVGDWFNTGRCYVPYTVTFLEVA
jgi:hypothetical protein